MRSPLPSNSAPKPSPSNPPSTHPARHKPSSPTTRNTLPPNPSRPSTKPTTPSRIPRRRPSRSPSMNQTSTSPAVNSNRKIPQRGTTRQTRTHSRTTEPRNLDGSPRKTLDRKPAVFEATPGFFSGPSVPLNKRLPLKGSLSRNRRTSSSPGIKPRIISESMPTNATSQGSRIQKLASAAYGSESAGPDIRRNWLENALQSSEEIQRKDSSISEADGAILSARSEQNQHLHVTRRLNFETEDTLASETCRKQECTVGSSLRKSCSKVDECTEDESAISLGYNSKTHNSEVSFEVLASIVEAAQEANRVINIAKRSASATFSSVELNKSIASVASMNENMGQSIRRAITLFLRSIPSVSYAGNSFRLLKALALFDETLKTVPTSQKIELGYAEILLWHGRAVMWCLKLNLHEKNTNGIKHLMCYDAAVENVKAAISMFQSLLNGSESDRLVKSRLAVALVTLGDLYAEQDMWEEAGINYEKASSSLFGNRRGVALYKKLLASELACGKEVRGRLVELQNSGAESIFAF